MQELRLRFTPSADGSYHVRLTDAAGAELGVPCDFTPFLADKDYEELRWYLEDYMDLPDGGAVVRAGNVEAQLKQWGRRLYDAVFLPEENHKLIEQLLATPEPARADHRDGQGRAAAPPLGIAGRRRRQYRPARVAAPATGPAGKTLTARRDAPAADPLHRQPAG